MQTAKGGYVYILSCTDKEKLYVGVTSNLINRTCDHKAKVHSNSYMALQQINRLVYYRFFESIEEAIENEKYLKGKRRDFKVNLINDFNPDWDDLFEQSEELGLE